MTFCQTPIDVAVEIAQKIDGHQSITKIHVETYKKAIETTVLESYYHPTSRAARTHSLPYCASAALVKKTIEYSYFDDIFLSNEPQVAELIPKVAVTEDKNMTLAFPGSMPCKITVTLEDGSTVDGYREFPRGDPRDPLNDREIESLQPDMEDTVTPLIDRALERIRELDLAEGEKLLMRALSKNPHNVDVMTHLFNLLKNNPGNAKFHEIAGRLLTHLSKDPAEYARAQKIYEEYLDIAEKPKLSPELYLQISVILSGLGQPEKAERIIALFLKKKPNYPGIPAALLCLAREYRQKQNKTKYQTCLKLLKTRYPASTECQMATDQAARTT